MSDLWTSQAMAEAMDGRPYGRLPEGVPGISIDTRTLQRGEAFFAIRGERLDGHDFATAAHVAGAGLLVVAEEKLPALGRLSIPMIVVADVLAALEKLGAAARARSAAKIIAVTGSAGKTTTKEALRHALSATGKVHASDKSFNNHWGVPLTLARMPADCDYAVFEIGMNHPGEIRPLSKLVRPHIAIVTLIAAAHLGHFKNLTEIAHAKAEIFEGIVPGGSALINRDDAHFALLQKLARKAGIKKIRGFGENPRSDYRLESCELGATSSRITASIAGHRIEAEIGVPGRHIVQNVLAVLGAAHLAGADLDKAAGALAGLSAERGRGMRHRLKHPDGEITLIDESYNANPASMQAAIRLLDAAEVKGKGRRIAVLGDMLELGAHSVKLHAELAEIIAGTRTDIVLLAGKEMKALADSLPKGTKKEYRDNVEEIIPLVLETVRPGDAVMVKSSNGVGFSRLVDALVRRYPAAGPE
ncbi:MAG: UDP-N-acetylmuramoylalanyl-D-glutamyl-2,6-diaminopimelate--D-alanyl-D-alanine ligase [Hyphomicrobiales bacterium]|nr:UDP-N-acetylmuramoylalanyl-D-glutamyl-2,6-diaminopimelate--D-alanyl-D-alanine ligase [Hyphomicrobiales bacterium]